jgi:cell division protein ZapA
MSTPTSVTVRILDKDYQVACPEEEKMALMKSAEFLNQRMREIRDTGKVIGLDRMAVMVALNLVNDLLKIEDAVGDVDDEVTDRVRKMRARMDEVLGAERQFEF